MCLLDELYSFRVLVTMVTEVGHFKLIPVVLYVLDHVLITVLGDYSTEDATSCTCTRRLGIEE